MRIASLSPFLNEEREEISAIERGEKLSSFGSAEESRDWLFIFSFNYRAFCFPAKKDSFERRLVGQE